MSVSFQTISSTQYLLFLVLAELVFTVGFYSNFIINNICAVKKRPLRICFVMEVLKDFDNADTISIDTLAFEESLEEERAREISALNSLSKKVCHLHTSMLYYRNSKSKMGVACYETWKTLVKKVGGTPDGWRDLGYFLGLAKDDLDYISTMKYEPDPADTVLKVFMQDEDSTLDKVLDAFLKMKRYDILKSIENSVTDMTQCLNVKQQDSGYHSNSKTIPQREKISYMKNLTNNLPPALFKGKEPNHPLPQISTNSITSEIKSDCPILFLTYTEDGLRTASKIAQLVEQWEDSDVTVITLNDRKDEVYQNPEKFIREYVEMADYVVPIITPGYLNAITTHNSSIPTTNDNLDHKYVHFVYNLFASVYIHANGCLNKKVRSVLPAGASVPWMMMSSHPVLIPWTCEADFNKQFKVFVRNVST